MLNVANKPFMLSAVILNVIMLSVVILNVIMLSVMALRDWLDKNKTRLFLLFPAWPGSCTIKLFTVLIYEFTDNKLSVFPWQAFPS
jgi:hypothetical protein